MVYESLEDSEYDEIFRDYYDPIWQIYLPQT